MKTSGRIWMAAIIAMLSASTAWSASLGSAISVPDANTPGTSTPAAAMARAQAAASPVAQQQVVDLMQRSSGVDRNQLDNALVGSSGGTALVSATYVANVNVAGMGADATRSQEFVNRTLNGVDTFGNALNGSEQLAAARILSGQNALVAASVGQMTVGGLTNTIDGRVASIMKERRGLDSRYGSDSAMASSIMNANYMNRFWVSGFHLNQDQDSKDGYAGYKYKATGGSVGYDHAFGAFTMGAAFTYSRGDFEQKGMIDDNDIDNYGVSVYANYYSCTGFFASVYGGYNYADNDLRLYDPTSRSWLSGDNHTNSWWGGGNVGYDFRVSNNFTLSPSVGIFYQHNKGSEYTFGGLQNFGNITSKGWTLPVQLKAEYRTELSDCAAISFNVNGGYSYNFNDKGATGVFTYAGFNDAPGTSIRGMKTGRHGYNIGAGMKYEYKQFDFGVDYRYDGRKKFDGHKVSATVGINF